MEAMNTDVEAMTLKQFGDDCFAITHDLQQHVENATVRVGSARFIVGGFEKTVYIEYENDATLALYYTINAAPDCDVSFMCAKAMVYALYTAARDVMIREHSTPHGATGRLIDENSEATASAILGSVTITMKIAYQSRVS